MTFPTFLVEVMQSKNRSSCCWPRPRLDRPRENMIRSLHVLCDLFRREHQGGTVVVETLGSRVGRESIGIVAAYAKQILDRVFVLRSVQSPQHDFARLARQDSSSASQFRFDPRRDGLPLFRDGLLFIFGRHFAQVEIVQHKLPIFRVARGFRDSESIDAEIRLLLVRPVALDAVGREENAAGWCRAFQQIPRGCTNSPAQIKAKRNRYVFTVE